MEKIEVVTINCGIERLDGFSGHSDYNQLNFICSQDLRPKLRRVLVNHGEKKKIRKPCQCQLEECLEFSTHYPQIQEAIKLF